MPDRMIFAGVDLSWRCAPYREKATAICIGDSTGEFHYPTLVTSDDEIVKMLRDEHADMVAIDASLKVPNETGMRRAELEAVRSGIHILPTNRKFLERTCGGSRGEELVARLEREGFRLAGPLDREGRLIFETYPFGVLHTICHGNVPRYKKGPIGSRKEACAKVMDSIIDWLPGARLPVRLRTEIYEATPATIKGTCDRIDALVCACCLYAHWSYGGKMTRMLGDEIDGYLLLV